MPRRNLNVDGGLGGKKNKVRKRGCLSSSSSSSLGQNYRLKRALLVGKKGGSTTPVPMWKMMSSESLSPENDKEFKHLAGRNGEKEKELLVTARKLAAFLWEINGVHSPGLRRDNLEDKTSEVGSVGKKRIVEQPRTDLPKPANRTSRVPASSQELQSDCDLAGATSFHNGLMQVYQMKNHVREHCSHMLGLRNRLKDVYSGLITSKELLKVLLRHGWRFDQQNPTSLSVLSTMEFELDRACSHVNKLLKGQMTKRSTVELLLKQLGDEKMVPGVKERDRTHRVITALVGELEMQKKLRRKTEKLNEKLVKDLSQTKASLQRANKELKNEKKAREMVEHVCDELARGIGEDRAKVDQLKSQSDKLREEVEKEREMLQLADMIREERVQMKLSEAKYMFEEKNALVDKLRNELEDYLKSKTSKEQGDGSPSYEKIKVLEKYLGETFPASDHKQETEKEDTERKEDEEEDSDDSDLCSIELNLDDLRKSFIWGEAVKDEPKRNSADKSKGRDYTNSISWECNTNKQENLDVFGNNGLLGFTSHTSENDIEDEMKRYKMIKDLRDHIVSGSRTASSQDLSSSSSRNLDHPSMNNPDAAACHS